MSSYGRRMFHEDDVERQYYSNKLRMNLMALVQKDGGKFPWEHEEWASIYPNLSRFLKDLESDYGKTEEDYFAIVSDFHKLSQKDSWVLESLHESLDRDLKKYVLPKRRSFKSYTLYFLAIIVGVFLGWAVF